MNNSIWIGTRKGLFVVEHVNNGHWQIKRTAFLGVPVPMVLVDSRSGYVYAGLGHGHFGVKLHRSKNQGVDWEELPAPAYPTKPDDVSDIDPIRNAETPWDLKMIWSLETGTPDQPGRLWCGTIPGGLFRSDDHGDSWQLVESLWYDPRRSKWFGGGADFPGIHSIIIHPSKPEKVTIAVSCGGVWNSEDSGNTWDCIGKGMWATYFPPEQAKDPNIQDVHRVVQCDTQPQTLWAQHHNGVFVSEDAGLNWNELKNVSPSIFGFTVVVHPNDPNTAWLVPANGDVERIPVDGKLVVSRTRDKGQTWEVLSDGLPQEHAYDIVFRHAMDIDASGNRLAMGSTTGSAWISENQGDSWQHLSAHLPPVYCVRFAKPT